MAKILIVEDEPDMVMGLADNLEFENYEVLTAVDGEAGLALALKESPDLILLDVMMPKMDGFEVCKRIRESGSTVPILMLTAKSAEIDKIRGLELGADDYVTKPFGVRELLARIKACLRRSYGDVAGQLKHLTIGEAEIDLTKGRVVRGDKEGVLGHYEIEILRLLAANRDQPVERNDILKEIWGFVDPTNRTVDNHVVSLRRKIEQDAKHPEHILTVHGIGYKLVC